MNPLNKYASPDIGFNLNNIFGKRFTGRRSANTAIHLREYAVKFINPFHFGHGGRQIVIQFEDGPWQDILHAGMSEDIWVLRRDQRMERSISIPVDDFTAFPGAVPDLFGGNKTVARTEDAARTTLITSPELQKIYPIDLFILQLDRKSVV